MIRAVPDKNELEDDDGVYVSANIQGSGLLSFLSLCNYLRSCHPSGQPEPGTPCPGGLGKDEPAKP